MNNIKNIADCIDLNDKNNISKMEYNLRVKAYKLNELVKIFNSDNSDFSKTMEMIKIYDNVESLIKAYNYYFTKINKIPSYLECNKREYFLLVNFYKNMEKNGNLYRAKYLTVILPFLINYEYSKEVINNFITYDSYELEDFLKEYDISLEDFKNVVNVISLLDKDTYNKYLAKCDINENNKYNHYVESIMSLHFGIKNDFMLTGEKFNVLVFLKNIPFISKNRYVLFDFIRKNIPECYDTIFNYMLKNGLLNDKNRMNIDKGFIINGSSVINGRVITNEENKLIYNYILDNNLPTFKIVYNIVRDMYINGEINLNNNVKKVKTINN